MRKVLTAKKIVVCRGYEREKIEKTLFFLLVVAKNDDKLARVDGKSEIGEFDDGGHKVIIP